jgi:hypothetical protein
MKDQLIFIYALLDPRTEEIRYVGKTIQPINDRYSAHISVAKYNRKTDHAHCWIKSLLSVGLRPIMKILEETFDIVRETFWINFYRSKYKLTNFTDGGELGNIGKTWKVKDKSSYPRNIKSVIVIDLKNKEELFFKSVKDCASFLKIEISKLILYIKKKIIYKNFAVFYKNGFIKDKINELKYPSTNRGVCQMDRNNNFIKSFITAKEASVELKIDYSGIRKVLKGNLETIKNFKFIYNDLSE